MTDRELLEQAAKAAGIKVKGYFEDEPTLLIKPGIRLPPARWNPLTDDGDALRLAVTLYLSIKIFRPTFDDFEAPGMVEIWHDNGTDPIHVEYYDMCNGRQAATRRAIVRAAASIGGEL